MPLSPGQVVHGRYRVIAALGNQGGMSAVYEVMDTSLKVRSALKEMMPYPGTRAGALPELRDQFLQEARLLAGLRHPSLPRVTDHFEEDGNAYLVMDFIYGRRLDEVVPEKGRLSEEEVLEWARQLMTALAHCHEQGVIHRDVKPQNVIITWQGQAVLVDFGLAKLVDPKDPRTRTVMRGLGTPEYAPPEQYDTRKGGTDPRTDIYSLGATLYHALAGNPPPTATERVVDPEILVPVRSIRDDVSEVTEQVLLKAMSLQPPHRFQSIPEMYQALFEEPMSDQVPVKSVEASPGTTTMLPKPPRPNGILAWVTTRALRLDRRVGVGLAAVVVVSLVTIISLLAGQVSGGGVPTATMTPTATVTMAATNTSAATSTSTATPTPSPTPGPATGLPVTQEPTLDVRHDPMMAPPTATPTEVYVPPTAVPPTFTPLPSPTNTPEQSRPQPRPTEPPTQVPTQEPTERPTDVPTKEPTPVTIRTPPTPIT
jgi:predicted Ser/Thr protein kinase